MPTQVRAQDELTRLPILILNIHSQCNCRCVMCDIWQRKDSHEFAATALEAQRESLLSLGVRQVVLSGGEPLLHRELEAFCSFLHGLGIRITLLTTGLLLHKRAALVAAHVDEIIISIDGPAPVHNSVRRIPRAFETIARGIASVRSLCPAMPIAGRTTVQKQNHNQLRATVDAAHALGLDSISFLPADLTSAAFNREEAWAPSRQQEIALDTSEIVELEAEIEALLRTHRDDLTSRFIVEGEAKLRRLANRFREHLSGASGQAPLCNAPWVSAVVEFDGTVRPCFFHPPTGSLATSSLASALNTGSAQSFRSSLDVASNPICKRCVCSLNYKNN